jgi:anti-sigma regulatory factor (Ser/Thr protein kinase)
VSPAGSLTHEALLYRDADGYIAGTVAFIRAGLDAGDPVLVAVPGEHAARIRVSLGTTAGERADDVRFLDMSVVGRNPGRIIPGVLDPFVREHRGRRVRVIGEPIWPERTAAEYPGCVQHEAMINLALGNRPAWILCPYDVERLKSDIISDAYRTHPVMIEGARRWDSDGYAGAEPVVAEYNRPLPEPAGPVRSLTFDGSGLAGVRALALDEAVLTGIFPDRMDDLQLAVNEVATNAVTHGAGPGTLRVWREPDRVVCEVISSGPITDPLAGRLRPADDSERGRGLLLVHHVCDLVQLYAGSVRTVVRLHVLR